MYILPEGSFCAECNIVCLFEFAQRHTFSGFSWECVWKRCQSSEIKNMQKAFNKNTGFLEKIKWWNCVSFKSTISMRAELYAETNSISSKTEFYYFLFFSLFSFVHFSFEHIFAIRFSNTLIIHKMLLLKWKKKWIKRMLWSVNAFPKFTKYEYKWWKAIELHYIQSRYTSCLVLCTLICYEIYIIYPQAFARCLYLLRRNEIQPPSTPPPPPPTTNHH